MPSNPAGGGHDDSDHLAKVAGQLRRYREFDEQAAVHVDSLATRPLRVRS